MVDNNRKPLPLIATLLKPGDFALHSPESRAVARVMSNAKAADENKLQIEVISEKTMTTIDSFTVTLSSHSPR